MNTLENANKYEECNFYESAARVIHDINSPIATIEMCLFSLSEEIQSDTLSIIKSALQNVRQITQSFHAAHYAKSLKTNRHHSAYKTTIIKTSLNLTSLINTVIDEKRFEWHNKQYNLQLDCAVNTHHLNINACISDLKRMLSNLLNNAIEACPSTAMINLALTRNDDYLCLSINDNGIGMDNNKIKSHLMGLSTKHDEKGLGLSGAKLIMESIGGRISISSPVGLGATVALYFPISCNAYPS